MRKLAVIEEVEKVSKDDKVTANKITMGEGFEKSSSVKKGLRKGGPLSTIIFNMLLEVPFKESGIKTNGIIYSSKNQCRPNAYPGYMMLMTSSKKEILSYWKIKMINNQR